MYRCPQCQHLSISGGTTFFMTLNGTTTCPRCMSTLRIKRKSTNYLVIAYMCLRAILSSVLPDGYDVGLFIEANVIIALLVAQFLFLEYEVASPRTSHESPKN